MKYILVPTYQYDGPVNVGDYCKLMFKIRVNDRAGPSQSLWVSVSDLHAGDFAGMLENDSTTDISLKVGRVIDFARRHIHQHLTPNQVKQFGHIIRNRVPADRGSSLGSTLTGNAQPAFQLDTSE